MQRRMPRGRAENMKISIARTLAVFGAVVCLGICVSIGIQNFAFQKLRVNGPAYHQIVNGKDLVADILPPPLFVVESYMLALEAEKHPDLTAYNVARIKDVLKPAFEDRRAYWAKSDLKDTLNRKLTDDVLVTGDAFWKILLTDVIPVVTRNDGTDSAAGFAALRDAFHTHTKAIDELVAMAISFQSAAEEEAASQTTRLTTASLAAAAISVVLLFAGLYGLRRRAVVPLAAMRDYMAVLAGGDYTRPVPFDGRSDEIGEMAKAVAVFREGALERIESRDRQETEREGQLQRERQQHREKAEEEAERGRVIDSLTAGLSRLAVGDLTFHLAEPFAADYEDLRQQFNASIRGLADTLGDIAAATATVRTGSTEIARSTDDLAKRTETQAASLEQAAAALDEITATVKNSSARAAEASTMMTQTKDSAERSAVVVSEAVAAMGRIEESAGEIRQIINVIDEIAFQTNLLALNAGVEAARAGESGRGFAVVAQEVRDLAGRSAKAAKEIKHLIESSSTQVATGVSLVSRTGEALGDIDAQVHKVNGLIEAIVLSSVEQSTALLEVNAAVNRMDQVTQQNAAMVEETNAACRGLSDEAAHLNQLLGRFALDNTATNRAAA